MDKVILCKKIGEFFGTYFEEGGQLCIDNGEEIFRYDTPDELLKGWIDTLVWHQHDTFGDPSGNWENEIVYIYAEVFGKFPIGVKLVEGPRGKHWYGHVCVANGKPHGKNMHLGTYSSIVDAIFARKEFDSFARKGRTAEELIAKAKEISLKVRTETKFSKAPKCSHCGAAII